MKRSKTMALEAISFNLPYIARLGDEQYNKLFVMASAAIQIQNNENAVAPAAFLKKQYGALCSSGQLCLENKAIAATVAAINVILEIKE